MSSLNPHWPQQVGVRHTFHMYGSIRDCTRVEGGQLHVLCTMHVYYALCMSTIHYACLLCTIHVYYAQGASYSISPAYYSCRPSPGSPETWDDPSIRPWHPARCHERHPMTWFVSPAGEPSIFQNFLFNGGIQELWINPRWNVFLKGSSVLCFLIILDL